MLHCEDGQQQQQQQQQQQPRQSIIVWIIASFIALHSCLFGAAVSCMAPFIKEGYPGSLLVDIPLSIAEQSLASSLILFACIPSCLFVSLFVTWFGPRLVLQITSLIWLVAGILMSIRNIYTFLMGRLILGIALGVASAVPMPLLCELSSATSYSRSILGTFHQGGIVGTILLVDILAYPLVSINGGWWWLNSFIFIFLGLLSIICSCLIPQSPTYLLRKGHERKAFKVLYYLRFGTLQDFKKQCYEIFILPCFHFFDKQSATYTQQIDVSDNNNNVNIHVNDSASPHAEGGYEIGDLSSPFDANDVNNNRKNNPKHQPSQIHGTGIDPLNTISPSSRITFAYSHGDYNYNSHFNPFYKSSYYGNNNNNNDDVGEGTAPPQPHLYASQYYYDSMQDSANNTPQSSFNYQHHQQQQQQRSSLQRISEDQQQQKPLHMMQIDPPPPPPLAAMAIEDQQEQQPMTKMNQIPDPFSYDLTQDLQLIPQSNNNNNNNVNGTTIQHIPSSSPIPRRMPPLIESSSFSHSPHQSSITTTTNTEQGDNDNNTKNNDITTVSNSISTSTHTNSRRHSSFIDKLQHNTNENTNNNDDYKDDEYDDHHGAASQQQQNQFLQTTPNSSKKPCIALKPYLLNKNNDNNNTFIENNNNDNNSTEEQQTQDRYNIINLEIRNIKSTLHQNILTSSSSSSTNNNNTNSNLYLFSYWSQLYQEKKYRKQMLMGCLLMLIQALGGSGVIGFFCTKLFGFLNMDLNGVMLGTISIAFVAIIFSFISPYVMDHPKIGRRGLVLGATSCCCLSFLLLSISLLFLNNSETLQIILSLISILTFQSAYNIGQANAVWVWLSEIIDLNILPQAQSFFSALNWGVGAPIIALTLPVMMWLGGGNNNNNIKNENDILKHGAGYVFLFFVCTQFIMGVLVYFYFPETLNIPSEDIQVLLGNDQPKMNLQNPPELSGMMIIDDTTDFRPPPPQQQDITN